MIHNKNTSQPKSDQTPKPGRVKHSGGGAPGPKYTIPAPPPNPPKKQ